jgi:hypothetical protein
MQGNESGEAPPGVAAGSKERFVKRFRKHVGRKHVALVLALSTAAVVALIAGSASGTTITAGNLVISIDGSVSPKALPKNKLAPITLNVQGSIKTNDGTHVPALQKLALLFDKHGTIFTKGLPTCRIGQITNTLTSQAKKTCGDALVGVGKVTAEVQFPDANPVPASGTLLIFNGQPKGGDPVLIQHAYVNNPVAATVITTARITNVHGKYGKATTITIPPVAGGYGSLASFTAKVGKSWTYKGKKQSLLLAECANGHFFAHGDFTFVNGTSLHGDVVKSCTQKG